MGFLSKLHKKHKKAVTGGTSKATKLSPGAKILTGGNNKKATAPAMRTGGPGQKSTRTAPSMSSPSRPVAKNAAHTRMNNLGVRSPRKGRMIP